MYAICVRLSVGMCVHVSTAPCKQEVPDPLEKALVWTSVLRIELNSSRTRS